MKGKTEKTGKRCTKCGQEVWIEDGCYCCECDGVAVEYVREGLCLESWVEEGEENMSVVTIKRDHDGTQPPNSWWINTLSDGRIQVLTRCANGHIGSLDDHTIADDGTVSPSVVCQKPGCNFHEFIRLDEWPRTK